MIAVLPPDCPEELLSEFLGEIESRGWKASVSRGAEQTLVAVAGPGDREELEELFAGRTDADVLELLTRREYRHMYFRRRLMHGIVAGLALLVALGIGLPTFGFLRPPAVARNLPGSVRVGDLSELGENSARLIRLNAEPVLLVRLGETRLFALDATCTHMQACLLEWDAERLQIRCPCHSCVFDVYGNVVEGPASVPLASRTIERIGKEILVRH